MISSEQITIKGLGIWLICAAFFMYEFMLRTVVGTFEQPIMSELNLTLFTFALISSTAYIFVYGLMQMPVGLMTDRLGLKLSLSMAALLCSLSVFGFSQVSTYQQALIFRILMGLGSSFGFIALLVSVYEWLPRKRLAFFIGLSQLIGTLGPMLAAGPMNTIAESGQMGWRMIFSYMGGVGVILTLLIFLVVQNNKNYTGSFQILKTSQSLLNAIRSVLTQKQLWVLAIYSGSVYFTIEYLSENSGKAFLVLKGVSSSISSYLLTIAWIGYAIGCPLLGYISDRVSKRKPVMTVAALLAIISTYVIVYITSSITIMYIAFFCLGVGASGQSIAFAVVSEYCQETYLAAGLGFNNAIIAFFTSINAPLISWLISYFRQHSSHTIEAYQHAFSLIILLLGVALMCSILFIDETFCKSQKEPMKLEIG